MKKIYTLWGQKGKNRSPEPKISMVVWYIHRSRISHEARKNIFLGVKKLKIGLQSPKTEFGAQNHYGRVIHPSIGNFTKSKKNILLGVKKVKIGPQSPNTEFGAQNQYGRVIYPSIGNWHGVRKNNFWVTKRQK
jgi:hypothetical protein